MEIVSKLTFVRSNSAYLRSSVDTCKFFFYCYENLKMANRYFTARYCFQLLKPHCKPIHQITINEQRTLLVTCGLDKTIFMYKLELKTPFILHRLGFIETPNNVEYMTWKPSKVSNNKLL